MSMKFIDQQTLKRSLFLAWPIALQSILTNLLSMIDVVMVSHLGDAAVGAVGLGNRFQFMIVVIILGISWAAGILSAQFYGAGKVDKIRSTVGQACLLAGFVLIPIILLNIAFADRIIGLGSNDPEVIRQGKYYLWFTIPSLLLVAVILAYESAIRSIGQVKVPMILSTIAIVANIALNFWLINGGLGVPPLGVAGAALATAIARLLQVGLIFAFLYQQKHQLAFRRSDLPNVFDRNQLTHFLKLAAPMMASFGVWSAGTFVYQIVFGRMGTQQLAVMSLLAPIEAVFLSLFFGLSSACSIMVGQALGANRFNDAEVYARSFALMNPMVAFVFGIVVLLCRDIILSPFSGMDAETLRSAYNVFALVAMVTWLKVINMTLAMGVLRAGGDNKACIIIDTFGMWVVSIPLTFFAAFYLKWPLFFVVLVTYSEELAKVSLFIWQARRKRWMKNLTTI